MFDRLEKVVWIIYRDPLWFMGWQRLLGAPMETHCVS